MQPLSLWLRWGVPQDPPTLTLTSGSSDNTPDFVLSGDLAVSDTVRFSYSTDSGFSGASEITNTIDAGEDAANSLSFATGALANGTWYFRARVERPPRGITAWSNVETITLAGSAGGPISLFGRWFGGFGAPPLVNGGYISLFGRWFGGFGSSGAVAPTKRGGGTYLTQAELRRLRKQLDAKENKDRTARDRQLETITQAYDDIVHPEIRIARQANERARQIQDEIEQEEQEFLLFLLDNPDTLH